MNEPGIRIFALHPTLARWMFKGWPAALILVALGVLIGLLARLYLPTVSLLELMRSHP